MTLLVFVVKVLEVQLVEGDFYQECGEDVG